MHAENNRNFPIIQPNFYLETSFHPDWVNSWVNYWFVPHGILVNQDVPGKEKVLISSICYFPWYKYSHHNQSQTPNMMSLNGGWKEVAQCSHNPGKPALCHLPIPNPHSWGFVHVTGNKCDAVTSGVVTIYSQVPSETFLMHGFLVPQVCWLCNFPDIQGCLWPCFQTAAWPHNYLPLGFAEVPELQPGRRTLLLTLLCLLPHTWRIYPGDGKWDGVGGRVPHFLSKCFSVLCPISSFFWTLCLKQL